MFRRCLICVALLAIPTTGLAQCVVFQQPAAFTFQQAPAVTFQQVPAFTFVQQPVAFASAPFVSVQAPFTNVQVGGAGFVPGQNRIFIRRGLFGRRVTDIRF